VIDATSNRPKIYRLIQIGCICGILIWLVLLSAASPRAARPDVQSDILGLIRQCVENSSDNKSQVRVGTNALTLAQYGCINYVRDEYAVLDYNIRRAAFTQQQFRGEILLWMVVIITFGGVGLAALQLYAAYRLAQLADGRVAGGTGDLMGDGQLSIEHGKVSVRSSVTGLLVLTLSLAFFVVYVAWVYPITQIEDKAKTAPPATTSNNLLPGVGQILEKAQSLTNTVQSSTGSSTGPNSQANPPAGTK
jgi:hypothetical protein